MLWGLRPHPDPLLERRRAAARIRRHTKTRRLDGDEGNCGMNTSQVCSILPPPSGYFSTGIVGDATIVAQEDLVLSS